MLWRPEARSVRAPYNFQPELLALLPLLPLGIHMQRARHSSFAQANTIKSGARRRHPLAKRIEEG